MITALHTERTGYEALWPPFAAALPAVVVTYLAAAATIRQPAIDNIPGRTWPRPTTIGHVSAAWLLDCSILRRFDS
jgi:hypothetical protein